MAASGVIAAAGDIERHSPAWAARNRRTARRMSGWPSTERVRTPTTDEEDDAVSQEQPPQEAGPKPKFPEQEQDAPGLEQEMDSKPDYGEDSYRGFGRLEGKAAIITGGDSGIGRAVAVAFAREGADVLISYLDEEPDAQETVRIVEAAGRTCIAVPGDIGDPVHCQQIVQRALDAFGRLDILVNNAAYQM